MKSRDRSTLHSTRKQVNLSDRPENLVTGSLANSQVPSSTANDIGNLGENLVAQWLEAQGWEILHRRWRCRWGEIDIIAIAEGVGERGEMGRMGEVGEMGKGGDSENSQLKTQNSRLKTPQGDGGDWEMGRRGEDSNCQLLITNYSLPTLIFVEVKTRSRRNWDADGMLAVNATKQAKLWQAAEIFLSDRPNFADYPCRFDVAIVRCEPSQPDNQQEPSLTLAIGQPVIVGSSCLTLQKYIESAFSH